MGSTDEREYGSDTTREAGTDEVESHGLTGGPTEQPPAERSSDETDDVEAHGMIGAPTDAPTEAPTD